MSLVGMAKVGAAIAILAAEQAAYVLAITIAAAEQAAYVLAIAILAAEQAAYVPARATLTVEQTPDVPANAIWTTEQAPVAIVGWTLGCSATRVVPESVTISGSQAAYESSLGSPTGVRGDDRLVVRDPGDTTGC